MISSSITLGCATADRFPATNPALEAFLDHNADLNPIHLFSCPPAMLWHKVKTVLLAFSHAAMTEHRFLDAGLQETRQDGLTASIDLPLAGKRPSNSDCLSFFLIMLACAGTMRECSAVGA
jgi:hypothetical protein